MQIRMDRRDEIPIVEWQEFLAAARRAGATDDATVAEMTQDADSTFVVAFAVDEDIEGPESVTIPAEILHDLLFVARTVASSDGDVRGLEESARKTLETFNDHFLAPVIGLNPYDEDDEDESEGEA